MILALFAFLALVAAAGCAPDDAGGTLPDCRDADAWPAGWAALEEELVAAVNERRAAGATCVLDGVPFAYDPAPAVRLDPAAGEAARCHSVDMARTATLSHVSSGGGLFWARMEEAGYTGAPMAENVAAGYRTAAAVVDGWMASTDGHCNALMDPLHNEVGVGHVATAADGAWWTADFGHRP